MIEQAEFIKYWCQKHGFKFSNIEFPKVDSSNDYTIYIKGFLKGSHRISIMYGGIRSNMILKIPIDDINIESQTMISRIIPSVWKCARCNNKTLNLRTDDSHKTYVCKKCYNNG